MQRSSLPTDQPRLESLRQRRAELRDSMTALEHALAAAAGADPVRWTSRVHTALVELAGDLRTHIEITESPDGLYPELLQVAPRLSEPVGRLLREHVALGRRVEELLALLERGASEAAQVRDLGTALLAALSHHRQRGADLVYEAYQVDLGGDN